MVVSLDIPLFVYAKQMLLINSDWSHQHLTNFLMKLLVSTHVFLSLNIVIYMLNLPLV